MPQTPLSVNQTTSDGSFWQDMAFLWWAFRRQCEKERFITSSSTTNHHNISASQTTLWLSLSLAILCLVGTANKSGQHPQEGDGTFLRVIPTTAIRNYVHRTARQLTRVNDTVQGPFAFIRETIRKLLQYALSLPPPVLPSSTTKPVVDLTVIQHMGCCQCESVCFYFEAPRTLKEESLPPWLEDDQHDQRPHDGALPTFKKKQSSHEFPKTSVPLSNFIIMRGGEHLRNYQKPSSRRRQAAYEHPIAFVAIHELQQAENKNMIKTFCAKCGTHLFWKSPHDVSRHVYVNLNCLQSDWIAMPKQSSSSPEQKAESRFILASQRHQRSEAMDSNNSSSRFNNASDCIAPHQIFSQEPTWKEPIMATPTRQSFPNHVPLPPRSLPVVEQSTSFSELLDLSMDTLPSPVTKGMTRETNLIREEPLVTDDEVSWTKPGEKTCPIDAEDTASTITVSSTSVAGWRLRDPSPSNRSIANAWEERLSDKLSQDALLYHMRKHLANHGKRTVVPPPTTPQPTTEEETLPDDPDSPTNTSTETFFTLLRDDDNPNFLTLER